MEESWSSPKLSTIITSKFSELFCDIDVCGSSCAAETSQLCCPVWNYLTLCQPKIWSPLSYHNYCSITCGQVSKRPCVCVLPFICLSVLQPGLCAQSCLLGLDFSSVTFHSATGDWGGGGLEVNEKQESESGLKMLRDQRGKVGRGRVWCWEEEQGGVQARGRFVFLLAFQSCAI